MSILDDNDLAVNNAKRIPVALCIDTSESMGWDNKKSLMNQSLMVFYDEIRSRAITKNAVDIAVIFFSQPPFKEWGFKNIRSGDVPQINETIGQTYLGTAVNRGIDLLEARKQEYKSWGRGYYQPWLVILTDGKPEGENDEVTSAAAKRCRDLEAQNGLVVIPGYIGKNAEGLSRLNDFSLKNKACQFDASKLGKFFQFLSASAGSVARGSDFSFNDFAPGLVSMGDII